MKLKLPASTQNWVSLIGATIAIIAFFMIVFLFVVSTIFNQGGSYLGLVVYIILPAILIFGLILIPVGMFLKNKKIAVGEKETKWPKIDFNIQSHRNAFMIFAVGTSVFLLVSAVGSYEAFHYTESTEFCGTLCHEVMEPEYTAYQNSPHARVACVDCHVGEGADWFVRSKMSGLYQVYAVAVDNYPRPIPTPIKNLRPARETCERCHWPEKFYSRKLRYERHYLSDEENTEWDIGLTMKIGAPISAFGLQEGIHWHINPDVKVEYISTEEDRMIIPWVRYTNLKSGEEYIYEDEYDPIDPEELANYEIREMDCMDCHNRPSHNYKPPAFFIDNAITAGKIPKKLPEIKMLAMEILAEEFETSEGANAFIDSSVTAYYNEYYPEIAESDMELITQAVSGIQTEFNKNVFPEMRVKWDVYPNQIGHVEFDGCFRCHDDNHISESGRVIEKDCNQCHYINAQGNPDNLQKAAVGEQLEFQHPVDIGGAWEEMKCTECHTGLNP